MLFYRIILGFGLKWAIFKNLNLKELNYDSLRDLQGVKCQGESGGQCGSFSVNHVGIPVNTSGFSDSLGELIGIHTKSHS